MRWMRKRIHFKGVGQVSVALFFSTLFFSFSLPFFRHENSHQFAGLFLLFWNSIFDSICTRPAGMILVHIWSTNIFRGISLRKLRLRTGISLVCCFFLFFFSFSFLFYSHPPLSPRSVRIHICLSLDFYFSEFYFLGTCSPVYAQVGKGRKDI